MSSTKSFINTFILAIATLAISSCVPKATEKKAACGVNQAFSSVSRSCYSIEELRTRPVGTTATVAMSEETPKTITLAYTDGNKDKAVSCKVSSISTSLEMITPSLVDGGLFSKADEVYLAASNIATELVVSEVAMRDALLKAKASQYYPTVVAQLGVFKAQATSIIALGAGNANSTVQYYYTLGQERMLVFTSMMTNMTNRCECSGGICTTVAIPKLNKSGAAGFSYTVTDVDGESAAKSTAVTITAMSMATAHLNPVAQSGYYNLNESSTSVATAYNITIPDGNDLTGVANSTMRYYFNGTKNGSNQGETTNGKVTGCMDLSGSTGLTDKTCIYTPSGDAFDAITPIKASVVIGDLTFTGVAEGTAANSFTVQYFDLQSNNLSSDPYVSAPQIYGLVSGAEEAFIRVAGNAIKIFINPGVTTSTQIQTLVNAHKQASLMVKVTGATGLTPSPSLLTPTAVSLTGGVDAFDKIPFYVNNLQTSSVNTAYMMIKMNSVDDVPAMNYVASAAATYLEDPSPSPILVNLSTTYSDVDTDTTSPGPGYYNTCNIDPTDALFFTNFPAVGITCTCALSVCTASITPNIDVSSATAFSFRYRIGSVDTYTATTKYSEYRPFYLTMTPVNDAPQISEVAIVTGTPVTDVSNQTMLEGESKFIDIWIGPGGSGFETSQTSALTLTATSNNLTLLPAANLVVSDTSPVVAGKKRITYTPVANQSGVATITLTLNDHGGVTNSGVEEQIKTFDLTVTPVNNPPVFSTSITAIHTNEGGAVQSDAFVIDEDAGGSPDENYQSITIDSIVSDNTSVLPNSAIKIFYDLNDNGVEDTGEARVVGDVIEGPLAADASIDVKLHKLYLKLDPVDGISGNANITLTISDQIEATDPKFGDPTYLPLTNQSSTSFSLVVHPVAALHGGWSNISSVGIKTDKEGAPVSAADIACNYNLTTETNNCGASPCTGTASPNGVIIPSAANTIFWDSSNLRCYRSTGTTEFTWVDHNTSCPVTKGRGTLTTLSTVITSASTTITVASTTGFRTSGVIVIDSEQMSYTGKTATTFTGVTRGVNSTTAVAHSAGANIDITDFPFVKKFIADASPVTTAANQYFYTVEDKSCHQSYYDGTGALVWGAFNYQPAKVTLAWKPFIMVGSGADSSVQISGWNVYRRDAGTDFNLKGGHLKNATSTTNFTITDPSIRTFTDTTAIAGRVYYYVVRPVDNLRLFPTYTPESFSEVRVVASPSNYSFVHRWIVNQEMCNGMNITTTTTPHHVDQTKNFRCEYSGPGSVNDSGVDYYDYGKDLLVDTQEAGCAYAAAPACTTNRGCIGIGNPATLLYSASLGDMYYDRNSGVCYVNADGAQAWTTFETSAITVGIANKANSALNAPLTNLTKAQAIIACNTRPVPVLTKTVAGVVTNFSPAVGVAQLPNKKDYMAYASQKITATDPEITEMEQGYSLNIQSRCNGSSASGLETAFTDAAIPSTSFIYSLPGTFSSGIRSLYTGSIPWASNKGTEACVSRFGIQDLYGNVAEWVDDGMTCDPYTNRSKVCTVNQGGTGSFTATDYGTPYSFNNVIGPYNEGGDSIVTYPTTTAPGGLTIGEAATLTVTSTASFPASGVLIIDNELISYASKTATTFDTLVRGYNSTVPAAHAAAAIVSYPGIDDSHLTNWTFGDQFFGASYFNYPLGLPLSSNINQAAYTAYLDWILAIGPSSGITTNKLHEDGIIVNGSVGAAKSFAVGGSYLSGNRAGRFSSELIDDTVSTRRDVGFRCIVPINPADTDNLGDYPVDPNYTYPP